MFEYRLRSALKILNQEGGFAGQPLSLSSHMSESDLSLGTVYVRPCCASILLLVLFDQKLSCFLQHLLLIMHPHFVIFDHLDGALIRRIVLTMDSAAGPSGLDTSHWKCLCTSFSASSDDLCEPVAALARKLWLTQQVFQLLCLAAS